MVNRVRLSQRPSHVHSDLCSLCWLLFESNGSGLAGVGVHSIISIPPFLPQNIRVQTRFLIGPAGSGKTTRCLADIRAELRAAPDGPPLIFLAPKQATFQIERQLLAGDSLRGYTRLQILSFDRLADYVLGEFAAGAGAAREALSDEGRVMVLRALLARHQARLRIFRSTARLPGFAQHLSLLLRELQENQIAPDRLVEIAAQSAGALGDKLHDAALLLRAYHRWLEENNLEDAHTRLDAAAAVLNQRLVAAPSPDAAATGRKPRLWLDGFAEMTPQELHLLAAFVPCCDSATLAFCLASVPPSDEDGASWLSLWTVVAQTFRRCQHALGAIEGNVVTVEELGRNAECGMRNAELGGGATEHRTPDRFAKSPVLAHVEARWANPEPFPDSALRIPHSALHIVSCANPEAEAVFAAREIRRFIRDRGARFRDCAVLLRTLDGHHAALRRVFTRYEIPFFLDRREPVTHHPLAELTRFALRTAAYGWRRDDWFGALKTGLVHRDQDILDRLENEALRRGWDGARWTAPLVDEHRQPHPFEPLRLRLTPPFQKLAAATDGDITGPQLAAALRVLWRDLDVEHTLQDWTIEARTLAPHAALIHDTVWAQMNAWLDNVERAFAGRARGSGSGSGSGVPPAAPPLAMPAGEWLPVLEAGLAGLSVGVIPPALDQVLVGSIDRSRNPELRLALVLGMNETVFPAPPPRPPILTEVEREKLAEALSEGTSANKPGAVRQARPAVLSLSTRQRLAHERYFAYIACTRASERLVLTCSAADSRGRALNPSPFLAHLERLVPGVFPAQKDRRETFSAPGWREAEHPRELAAPILLRAHPALDALRDTEDFATLVRRHEALARADGTKRLSPEVLARLYPGPLATSVSALENFAACPFKFFVSAGLRVEERKEFEVDHRQRGSFQHDILDEFHKRATADGRQWRDWAAPDARALVREIGEEKLAAFENGIFNADAARQFAGRTLVGNLENLVGTLVEWMSHYAFNPHAVELEFGITPGSPLPGWRIALDGGRELLLRGRIDRLDLGAAAADGQTPAVVVDYKSSPRKLDAVKLHNGLELQLLSYVGLLRQVTPAAALPKLTPVGVFYVSLRGNHKSASLRDEALDGIEAGRRSSFQHSGRFDKSWYDSLDSRDEGEQFTTHHASRNAQPPEEFEQLIAGIESHLREFGNRILDGAVEVAPFRKSGETACDHCEFGSICRFDSWTESFRRLKPVPKKEKPGKPAERPAKGARKAKVE